MAQPPPPARPVATLLPTAAAADPPTERPPQPTDAPDTGWLTGDDGVELRRLRVPGEDGRPDASLTIVRLDPARVRLRVAYTPEQPRALRAWFDEQRPLLAINGGFFDQAFRSTALVVSVVRNSSRF